MKKAKVLALSYGNFTKVKALNINGKFILTIECEKDFEGKANPNSRAIEYPDREKVIEAFNQFKT